MAIRRGYRTNGDITRGQIVYTDAQGYISPVANDGPVGVVMNSPDDQDIVSVMMPVGIVNVQCDDGKVYTMNIKDVIVDDIDDEGRVRADSRIRKTIVERPLEHIRAKTVVKRFVKQGNNEEVIKKRLDAI